MSYLTLSSQEKNFFYSVDTFTRIRQHNFSKNFGGPMHGPFPPPQIWGDRHKVHQKVRKCSLTFPSPPRSPPLLRNNNYYSSSPVGHNYYDPVWRRIIRSVP